MIPVSSLLCRPAGSEFTIPPESTELCELAPLRQLGQLPKEFQPSSWFEEYPRPTALKWELAPHKASEAEHHFNRLEKEDDRLFNISKNHKIRILDSDCDVESGKFSGRYRITW